MYLRGQVCGFERLLIDFDKLNSGKDVWKLSRSLPLFMSVNLKSVVIAVFIIFMVLLLL